MHFDASFRPEGLVLQRFSVAYEYPVLFCREALSPEQGALVWAISRREPERRHPLFVVLDGGLLEAMPELESEVALYVEAHAERLNLLAPAAVLPGGEASKNDPALITELQARLARAGLDRHGTLLIIGGGAVLDAAGYAGSTTHRGVRIVRMPSTVLAQNDAGVGVKTSLNAYGAKNFLGTFAPPFAVINDATLLRTLPLRDARAGLAEAVKVALIRDADFFAWLERHAPALGSAEPDALEVAIKCCAELHLQHIATAGDPFEQGSVRPLDYGHWAAHKLELLSEHELRHGEAVAIGMALDAAYAHTRGLLSAEALERICTLLEGLGLALFHPLLAATQQGELAILRGLDEFREHLGGRLTVTLLTRIGECQEVSEMDRAGIEQAIDVLERRQARHAAP
jgi:3-dehydroquinate synthase